MPRYEIETRVVSRRTWEVQTDDIDALLSDRLWPEGECIAESDTSEDWVSFSELPSRFRVYYHSEQVGEVDYGCYSKRGYAEVVVRDIQTGMWFRGEDGDWDHVKRMAWYEEEN